MIRFRDLAQAGRMLADRLRPCGAEENLLVVGLQRGGVRVAFEIARTLGAPLDFFVVRKLGLAGQEEVAMGGIGSGCVRVLNDEVVRSLGIDDEAIARVTAAETAALEQRERIYRGERGQSRSAAGPSSSLMTELRPELPQGRPADLRVVRRYPRNLAVRLPVSAAGT